MLVLVEHQLGAVQSEPGSSPARPAIVAGLEPESPEGVFLGHVESLDRAELQSLREEICLAALKEIDAHFASLDNG